MTCPRSVSPALSAAFLLTSLGAQNQGAAFDLNVDGYIEVPYSSQVVPQTGITLEAWFTYDDSLVPASWRYPTIARQGLSAQGENWFLRMDCDNSAERELRWKIVTTSGTVQTSYFFQPGDFLNWTHVAATYDGVTSVIYINGVAVSTANGNGAPIRDLGSDVLRIGKGSDVATPIEVWNGQLDEVRLWPFARSEADIMSTMDMELAAVPGLVSTWNLNGDYTDSSSTLNATSSGQVTFVSTPALAIPLVPAGLPAGASTPGCLGDLRVSPSGPATVGYTGFGVVCTPAPPGALAVWAASTGGVLSSPLPLLAIDVWVDPTGVVTLGSVADGLGAVRTDIPVAATVPIGFSFGIQCIVLDVCGPQLFTASDAMTVVTQ